jgi:hypothetical protein
MIKKEVLILGMILLIIPAIEAQTYDQEVSPTGDCFCVYKLATPTLPTCDVKNPIPSCIYSPNSCSGSIDTTGSIGGSCSCDFSVSNCPYSFIGGSYSSCNWAFNGGDIDWGTGYRFNGEGRSAECRSRDETQKCFLGYDDFFPSLPGHNTDGRPCNYVLLAEETTIIDPGATCRDWKFIDGAAYGAGFCEISCSVDADCPSPLGCGGNICRQKPTCELTDASGLVGSSYTLTLLSNDPDGIQDAPPNDPLIESCSGGGATVTSCIDTGITVTAATVGSYTVTANLLDNGVTGTCSATFTASDPANPTCTLSSETGPSGASIPFTINTEGPVAALTCDGGGASIDTCSFEGAGSVIFASSPVAGQFTITATVSEGGGGSNSCQGFLTTDCSLTNVHISPNCGDNICDPGETVVMTGLIGPGCASATNFQIDASTTPGSAIRDCFVQYITGYDIQGFNKDITINPGDTEISTTWTVPLTIPDSCKGNTVSGSTGELWTGGNPDTGTRIGLSGASGSITFYCEADSHCPAGIGCCSTGVSRACGVPEICANGIDDDCDGLTDCSDSECSCAGGSTCYNDACLYEVCTNNLDDEGDGFIDCADTDCNPFVTGVSEICTGSTHVGPSIDGNDYYCSYGFDDVQDPGEDGRCCQAGRFWDGTECREFQSCGDPIFNIDCHHDVGTEDYYNDPNCFQFTPVPWEQSCCPLTGFGGVEVRDFEDVIVS